MRTTMEIEQYISVGVKKRGRIRGHDRPREREGNRGDYP
jgi:hypothetical protein